MEKETKTGKGKGNKKKAHPFADAINKAAVPEKTAQAHPFSDAINNAAEFIEIPLSDKTPVGKLENLRDHYYSLDKELLRLRNKVVRQKRRLRYYLARRKNEKG